jgi:hypothetical protein
MSDPKDRVWNVDKNEGRVVLQMEVPGEASLIRWELEPSEACELAKTLINASNRTITNVD